MKRKFKILHKQRSSLKIKYIFISVSILLILSVFSQSQAAAAGDVGFRDFSYTGASSPTGQKPQSKLWFNDGLWWGSMFNKVTGRFEIYRFNWSTNTWSTTNTPIDTRRYSSADALWDGSHLTIVSALPPERSDADDIAVTRYSYNSGSKTYSIDPGFPVTIENEKVETVVHDRDSTGVLWVTFTKDNGSGGRAVYVTHTTTDDQTWVTPYVIPTTGADDLKSDDISTIVSYNGNIGVLWSNQIRDTVYFAFHPDGTSDSNWILNPAVQGPDYADDHLNIKSLTADSSGQVFAVVKTSLNDSNPGSGEPLILLLTLDHQGSWGRRTVATAADNHTRPIVLLDEENRNIYVFMTRQYDGQTSGAIYYKAASLDNASVQFPSGLGTPFIEFADYTHINNSSSTKQPLNNTTNLLVIAGDDNNRYYFHNTIDFVPDPPTPTPTPVTPTSTPLPPTPTPIPPTNTPGPSPTPTATFTPTPTPSPYTIFSDGFESGDFSAWTLIMNGLDGVAEVQSSVVNSGAFAAHLSETSNTGSFAYIRKSLDQTENKLHVVGHFMITQEGLTGGNVPLIRLFNDSGSRIISFYRQNLSQDRVYVKTDNEYLQASGRMALNTWVKFELYIEANGPGTSVVELYQDDVLTLQTTTTSIDPGGVITIQLGNETKNQIFELYADDIQVTAYSSQPPATPTPLPTDTPTPLPTSTPTQLPTNTATPLPTDTPTPLPTATPTPLLTATATPLATSTPTPLATSTPTPLPTDTPTPLPTNTPTPQNSLIVPDQYTSIQAAIDAAVPGDTILVRSGFYQENLVIDKSIVLVAETFDAADPSNNTTIIEPGSTNLDAIEILAGVSPMPVIRGFVIQNSDNGIRSYAEAIIEYNYLTIASDLIDLKIGAGGIIRNNILFDSSDDGIDIDDSTTPLVIENNRIYSSGDEGIELRLQGDTAPLEPVEITIRSNQIVSSRRDGIQIIDEPEDPQDTNRILLIHDNLIANNMIGIGFKSSTTSDYLAGSDTVEQAWVYNNTFYNNDYALSGGDNHVAFNNIFTGGDVGASRVSGLAGDDSVLAYNLFFNIVTNTVDSTVGNGNIFNQDPLFESLPTAGPDASWGTLDDDYDGLVLQPGSPAIDAGVTQYQAVSGNARPQPPITGFSGTAPDLGWKEVGGTGPTPTPSATPLPTATNTPLPTATATFTPGPSPTPTATPTATNTPLPTATFTPGPSPTPTPTATATATATATPTALPTSTGTPVPTSPPGELFSDGFESGDFSAWSGVSIGTGGFAEAQTDTVWTGSYAARLSSGTASSGSVVFLSQTLNGPETELTLSGYFMVEQEGVLKGNVPLFRIYAQDGTRLVSFYRQNLKRDRIWVGYEDRHYRTSGKLPLNTWGYFELHIITAGVGTSTVEVYQNGDLIYSDTAASLDAAGMYEIHIGNDSSNQIFQLVADNIRISQ